MRREIVINATGQETRVAIVEDGSLVELMHERRDAQRIVGDVYLGRVEAVLPGIQAAFVDIGLEKSGFLHASDASERESDDDDANGGGRRSTRYLPIQDVVSRGQDLLVQVTKEPISSKGPRVTAQVSLPGRFLVYMPTSTHVGVSRKIDDREERARLRKLAKELLKKERALFLTRAGGYKDNDAAFPDFVERVESIISVEHERFRAALESAQRPTTGSRGGAGSAATSP